MGHHHVLECPGRLVEGDPVVDAQGLGDVDLHVIDVVTVPDRLEEAVGETEGQYVLGRLLAQEVVDPEDLFLVEEPVHQVVERPGAGQVGAEGLLHDDPRPVHQVRLAQQLNHISGCGRRNAEVVQPPDVPADRRFGSGHGGGQSVRPRRLGHEAQPLLEPGPLQQGDLPRGVLVAGPPRQVAEVLVGELAAPCPDDLVLGEHARLCEVEKPRQEFARRKVTGGSEEHDHVGGEHRWAGRCRRALGRLLNHRGPEAGRDDQAAGAHLASVTATWRGCMVGLPWWGGANRYPKHYVAAGGPGATGPSPPGWR